MKAKVVVEQSESLADIIFSCTILFIFLILIITIICLIIFKKIPLELSEKWYKQIHKKLYPPDVVSSMNRHVKELNKQEYYTLHNYKHNDKKSINEFIYDFLYYHRCSYKTISKKNEYICGTWCRRSLGDIYLICRYYYPGCKIEEVLSIIINLIDNRQIGCSWCSQTRKMMFHADDGQRYIGKQHPTEYGTGFQFRDVMNTYRNG